MVGTMRNVLTSSNRAHETFYKRSNVFTLRIKVDTYVWQNVSKIASDHELVL